MSDSDELRAKLRAQMNALRSRIDPRLLQQVRSAYLEQLQGVERAQQENAKKAVELYLEEKRKNIALLQNLVKNLKGVRRPEEPGRGPAGGTAPPKPAGAKFKK